MSKKLNGVFLCVSVCVTFEGVVFLLKFRLNYVERVRVTRGCN